MYRLLSAVILALLISCGGGGGGEGSVIVTDNTPAPTVTEPETEDPTDPLCGVIVVAYRADNQVRLYDGQDVTVYKTGEAMHSGYRTVAYGSMLYCLDQQGRQMATKNTTGLNEFMASDGDLNLWAVEMIGAVESQNAGATPKTHTKIYYNSTEYGDWMTREFETADFIRVGSDVYAYGVSGGWRHINGTRTNINTVMATGLVVYDFDPTNRTATINEVAVSWFTNFMSSAKFWQKSGAVWYSQNGYTFDGTTLNEAGTVMTCWRVRSNYPITLPENASLICAGTRVEGGETCLYWIECNSGWLFKYVPSTNTQTAYVRLYTGDGYKSTGTTMAAILMPVISNDKLFFNFSDGQMYKTDLVLKTTAVFGPAADWITGW